MKRAGVRLSEEALPLLDEVARVNAKASFSSVESYAIHRQWLATREADYDPNVRARIELGGQVSTADYMTMIRDRATLAVAMDTRLADLDGLVLPTTPIVAPTIAEVSKSENFTPKNLLILRNTAFANFFDLCAISLPLPRESGLPVGLMVMARKGEDKNLFRMAAALERLFAA
jgi:aspartyl-tRNA(Asn)/glutamyl-tRNA(Gln) amidotransferase subunit A